MNTHLQNQASSLVAAFLAASLCLGPLAGQAPTELRPWNCDRTPLRIVNARLPEDPSRLHSVEIREGVIAAIDSASSERVGETGERVLDANGSFLLPGLIDAHAHLDTLPSLGDGLEDLDFLSQVLPSTARSTLASGVTAARIHLSRFDDLAALAEISADPCFPGPRLQLGGPGLLGGAPSVASPLMVGAQGPDQIAAHLFRAADLGAKWIALHGISRFDALQLATIEDVAAGADLLLMAAADNRADFETALDTSVRTLEYLDRSTNQRISPLLVERASGKVAVVPPVGYYRTAHDLFYQRHVRDVADPFLGDLDESLPTRIVEGLLEGAATDTYTRKTAESFSTHSAKFRQLREGGVDLLLGSDSGSPGQFHRSAIWSEISTWQDFGESSSDLLGAAGVTAAHWLDWPGIGEVRVGNHADLILHRGDPARGMKAAGVSHILKGGVVFVDGGKWAGPDAEQARAMVRAGKERAESSRSPVRRRFCTEIGSFDFLFYRDQVVGNYLILPRHRIGTFFGTQKVDVVGDDEGPLRVEGRWIDPDGEGDLLIEFSRDFLGFTTRYRSDREPETWYTNWGGARRRGAGSGFVTAGTRYQCE